MRLKLPSGGEVLLYAATRLSTIIASLFYSPLVSRWLAGNQHTQSQNTILSAGIVLAVLLAWMFLFFFGRRMLLGIRPPGIPEVVVYLVIHLLPFAMSQSGLAVRMFLWATNYGVSVVQFDVAYAVGTSIVVMSLFFVLRQLFAYPSATSPAEDEPFWDSYRLRVTMTYAVRGGAWGIFAVVGLGFVLAYFGVYLVDYGPEVLFGYLVLAGVCFGGLFGLTRK